MKINRSNIANSIRGTTIWRGSLACLCICVAVLCGCESALAQFAEQQLDQSQASVMAAPLRKSFAAIDGCRERRLKGEFANFWESALCSNPTIYSAWKEANYPYMDLIAGWLNARLNGSKNVDKGLATPPEFERQMGELTTRLTIEERKRRASGTDAPYNAAYMPPATENFLAGLNALQDSEPRPAIVEAPPVGPAPRIRQEMRKKSALRSASISPAASTLSNAPPRSSQLKEVSRDTPAPMGGPYVPAVYVQVSAQKSETEAVEAVHGLQTKFPSVLGTREVSIWRADLGSKGIYYRAQIGPFIPEQADRICNNLKAAGGQCFIQHN